MNENSPPTLRTIAARAGVSPSTVSLALRNHLSLPEATRRRIQQLADKMGYRPNPQHAEVMARVRARKHLKWGGVLAFLTSYPTSDGWRKISQVFRDYFAGAENRAHECGYRIEPVWAKETGITGKRLSAILLARGIRGLLVGPLPPSRGHLSLEWSNFTAVAMGYSAWKPPLSRVAVDHHQCVMLAWRRLRKLGYRRIGLALPGHHNERVNHHWSAAFLDCQQAVPKSDRIPALLPRTWTEANFLKWVRRFRPDVIIASGVTQRTSLKRSGIHVPAEVGLVAIQRDNQPEDFAGIRHNGRLIGVAAVDLLVGQLQRNEMGIPSHPKLVLIPGDWVDGPSVKRQSL